MSFIGRIQKYRRNLQFRCVGCVSCDIDWTDCYGKSQIDYYLFENSYGTRKVEAFMHGQYTYKHMITETKVYGRIQIWIKDKTKTLSWISPNVKTY